MQRIFLPLLLALALVACEPPAGPDDTNNPGSSTTVAMTQLTDLPMNGGDVGDIAIASDNSIVAIVDGKLYSMSTSGSPRVINNDADHMAIGLAPSGELYAVTTAEIRVYDLGTGSHRSVPIDPAGPLAINRRVELADVVFSPSGQPYVRMINNTPQTYVYCTTDKGATWTYLDMPSGFRYGGGLTFAPNGDILMSSTFGFNRSTDNGATWTTQSPARPGYGAEIFVATNGDIYHYQPGAGGLMVSRNGGASFTELTPFNRHPFFSRVEQGPDGALWGLAQRAGGPWSLLRSEDGGETWQHVIYAQGRAFAMRGSLFAIGLGSQAYGAEHGGVLISENAGNTWRTIGLRSVEKIVDIAFDKNRNLMMLADGGLYRRTSSGWQTLGAVPGLFSRFTTTGTGTLVLANTTIVFHSTDDGATWKENLVMEYTPGIDPASVTVLLGRKNGDVLMSVTSYSDERGYSNGHLYRIGSDGVPVRNRNVSATLSGIFEDPLEVLYGWQQTINPITYTFYTRNYRSSDGGMSWDELQDAPRPMVAFNSRSRFLVIGGSDKPFTMKSLSSEVVTTLKLEGFTSEPHYVRRAMFGPDDRLYLLTLDKGLFISGGPVL